MIVCLSLIRNWDSACLYFVFKHNFCSYVMYAMLVSKCILYFSVIVFHRFTPLSLLNTIIILLGSYSITLNYAV